MIRDFFIFIISLAIYIVFILMPIYFFIRKKKSRDVFRYLKLKENWQKGILIGSLISIIYIGLYILKSRVTNDFDINLNIGVMWLYGFSVGFLEELPIRGFLLRILEEKYSFIKANLISTLIFVILHFPNWIIGGGNILQGIISVSIVRLIFGYLVKEYDSLWITIICHSVFNISIWIGLA